MGQAIQYGSTLISELVSAIGAASLIGVPSAVTVFVMRTAVEFHDRISQQRLERIVRALQDEATRAKQKGTLINFTDERNLWGLFDKIEEYLRCRDEAKLELLGRVAVKGLIDTGLSDMQERNYRYVIRTLEMEDVQVLRAMDELRQGPRPVLTNGGSVPTVIDPEDIRRGEIPSASGYSIARLVGTGLIEQVTRYGNELSYRFTREGAQFLRYLQKLYST